MAQEEMRGKRPKKSKQAKTQHNQGGNGGHDAAANGGGGEKPPSEEAKPSGGGGADKGFDPTNLWIMRFTGALAVLAFFQLCTFLVQSCEAKRYTDISEQTLQMSEEPQIAVTEMSLDGLNPQHPAPVQTVTPRVTIVNYGHTPAFITYRWIAGGSAITETALKNPPSMNQPVMPGQAIHLTGTPIPCKADQVASLNSGATRYFVYGLIDWTDRFGARWETGFRGQYKLGSDASIFVYCPEGNYIKKL